MTEPMVDRLDQIIAVLKLSNRKALASAARELRADPAKVAVLEACADDWVGAGELTKLAMAQTNLGNSTVRGHIGELVEAGALARQGGGRATQYKSTGVI